MTTETPAKLPVWKTAAECYRLTFRHLGELLRFAWPWLLVLMAVSGALYWGLYPIEQKALAKTGSGSNVLWILTLLFSTVIGAFIAVPWHRLLLLGEKAGLTGSEHFSIRQRQYAVRAILLLLIPMLPIAALMYFYPASSTDAAATTTGNADDVDIGAMWLPMIYFGSIIALMALANRLSLILPATALGHTDKGWWKTWHMTQGNTWRLFWSSLIVFLPFVLAGIVAAFGDLFNEFANPAEQIKIAPVNELANRTSFTSWSVAWELAAMLFGMLYVTFLSLAYRHFTGLPVPESKNSIPRAP